MKIKKMLNLILFIFIVIYMMLGNNVVKAAGYDISATSNDVKVGENVKINVSFTAAAWNVTISGNGISGTSYASQTDDLSEKTITKTFNLDTSKAGNYTITISGDITDANGVVTKVNKSTTVKVTQRETTTPSTNTSTTQTPEIVKKSSDASLSNLGINPNDFTGFKSNKTEYSVEVPNSVSKVKVYATPVKGATVKGVGNVDLKEGNNTVKVIVTAEDGKTTKTYTLTIKRKTAAEEAEVAGEARLKNLGIKPEQYDFSGFNSDKTEYSVEIPNEVKEIEVYATAMSSKAQVTGTGLIELEEGKNELKVDVIAENGTKKTYTIEVTRKESEQTGGTIVEKFGLSTLSIAGLTLNPSFKVETYEYKVELNEDLNSLDIKAKANKENATVEIVGNENLQQGENVIKILVRNSETEEIITYEIIVNKNLSNEPTIQTSWLKPSTWGKEEKIKIAIIIVLIILIISAIILKIKIGKQNEQIEETEFPGADELDKAIAEHQELVAEDEIPEDVAEAKINTTEYDEISNSKIEQNYIQDIAKNRFNVDDFQEEIKPKPKKRGRHF